MDGQPDIYPRYRSLHFLSTCAESKSSRRGELLAIDHLLVLDLLRALTLILTFVSGTGRSLRISVGVKSSDISKLSSYVL